jgi:L-alanine-DL-glutamate epimerase-like enolase superfamily enzyme
MKMTWRRAMLVEMPFDRPVASGHGQFRSEGCVLVFLECGDGPVGEGLVFTLNPERLRVLAQLIAEMAPLAVGLDPTMAGALSHRAAASLRPFGADGFSAMACAATWPSTTPPSTSRTGRIQTMSPSVSIHARKRLVTAAPR